MPKYLSRVSFTIEGVRGLQKQKASHRRDAVAKFIEAAGGKLEAFYFGFGPEDVIVISELPDNIAQASISIATNAAGHVHLSTTPLMTVEEMDKAIEKSLHYPIPGG